MDNIIIELKGGYWDGFFFKRSDFKKIIILEAAEEIELIKDGFITHLERTDLYIFQKTKYVNNELIYFYKLNNKLLKGLTKKRLKCQQTIS